MLNFRNTNIFFIALLAVLVSIYLQYGLPIYVICLLPIVWSLIVFRGCYYVGSNFFIKIICKADTGKKEIAISFDDGPAENYTKEILEILKAEEIKATFFCIGNRIAGNEFVLKRFHYLQCDCQCRRM